MRTVRAWLDGALGPLLLTGLREATGRPDPLPALRPARAAALPAGRRVAFWSLVAGVGTSTTAALVAQRSSAGGQSPLLLDLDRWAPSLALRAGIDAATLADALLRPGREQALLSRWSGVAFLPGSPALRDAFDGPRVAELLLRLAAGRPAVVDLGAGADALDPDVLGACDRLCLCVGTRAAQLQAAFAAASLLRGAPSVSLVVVNAADEDAHRIAARLPWPLAAVIPADDELARDDFAVRAPTLRGIDSLIRALA